MTSNTIQLKLSLRQLKIASSIVPMALVAIVLVQDLMQARINGYSYYLSESLLFNSVWFLFLPIGFLLIRFMAVVNHLYSRSLSIILSVTLAIGIHIIVFPFMVWAISALCYNHTYAYWQVLNYTISHNIYQFFMVYSLLGFFIYQNQREKNKEIINNSVLPSYKKLITITAGTKNVVLPAENVLCIKASSPYIAFHTCTNKYLHLQTLKSVQADLDPNQFIRIHKSTVININEVKFFKSRLNGDYDVMLTNGESVRLSRAYSKVFKDKFKAKSTCDPNISSG